MILNYDELPVVNKRVYDLVVKYENGNVSKFAERIGVTQQVLNRIFKKDGRNGKYPSVSPDIKKGLLNSLGIDEISLLTGEGSMLKDESSKENSMPAQAELPKKRIPFYDDIATVGGTNHLIASDSPQMNPSEWIDAGDWFPEATAAIRHYGDSMIEYPSGSILALKRVEDHRLIIWGRNYSIETTEFRITKRLQDGGDDFILAYSSNMSTYPDGTLIHSPIKIPKETIRHIDLVLGCVTKEYSNGPVKIIK